MTRCDISGKIRVLVVDDDPDYVAMTAAFLERHIESIEVETASNADEGLSNLASEEPYDTVVSDYAMPGRDGLEFLEMVRERHADIPFILFTGKGSEEIASQAISAGVTDYIQKTRGEEQYERLANRILHATRARKAEQDATEAKAHLQAVADSAPDVIVTIDESSTIQFASPAIKSVFGYTPEEVTGEPLEMLMPERYRVRHSDGMKRYLHEGERHLDWTGVEFTGLHKDDHEVPLSISFGEFTRNGTQLFTGIIRDISDRKQQDRELEGAQEFIEKALNALDDVFFLFDENGSFVRWNKRLGEVTGYTDDEIRSMHPVDFFAEEDSDRVHNAIGECLETGKARVEAKVVTKDGEYIPYEFRGRTLMDSSGEQMEIAGIGRDLRDRKEAERATREQRERFDSIVQEIKDYAIFMLDPEGRIVTWNTGAEMIKGYSEEDILGEHFSIFYPAEYQEQGLPEQLLEQASEEGRAEHEGWRLREDGTRFWALVVISALYDENDTLRGFAKITRDITDRKQREDRLAGFNEMLAEFLLADDRQKVCEIAVDTAESRLQLPITTIGLFDDDAGIIRPVAHTTEANHSLNTEALLGESGGLIWEVFTTGDHEVLTDFDNDIIDATQSVTHLLVCPLGRHGVFLTALEAPDGLTDAEENFVASVASNIQSALDRIEHEELFRERETLLEKQNEQLDRQNRINDIIRRIDRTLVGATTRREIEETVCDELVAEGPYQFAWIGEHESTTGKIEMREAAGEGQDYLNVITSDIDDDAGDEGSPMTRTIQTHEPTVINEMLVEPPLQPWRKHALDRGFRSCMAIPLVYRDRLFGVLTLYSDQKYAFDELEQAVLEELGRTIAHAISALESTRALVSDKIVELKFEIDPSVIPFLQPIHEFPECELELESIVPEDENYRVFLTLQNITDEVNSRIKESTVIHSYNHISNRDGTSVVECSVTNESIVAWLLNHNAVPRSISIDERATITVELSQEADVREFVELFQAAYAGTELIARRERERTAQTRMAFQSELEELLTPRQQEILRTAYFSGFFNTPRERTGQEIASSIGISQPTFSDHLRAALRKMLGMLYDTEADPPD